MPVIITINIIYVAPHVFSVAIFSLKVQKKPKIYCTYYMHDKKEQYILCGHHVNNLCVCFKNVHVHAHTQKGA